MAVSTIKQRRAPNYLEKDNALSYTPSASYHPATKIYTDNADITAASLTDGIITLTRATGDITVDISVALNDIYVMSTVIEGTTLYLAVSGTASSSNNVASVDLSGFLDDTTLTNAQVIGSVLTGYTISTTSVDVAATDTIAAAIQKVEYRAKTAHSWGDHSLGGYSSVGHGHTIGDVTDLQSTLDAKYVEGTFASAFIGLTPAGVSASTESLPLRFQYVDSAGSQQFKDLRLGTDGLLEIAGIDISLAGHTHAYLSSSHDAKDVTAAKILEWDTAYGWGNHADTYSLLLHTHTKSEITDFGTYDNYVSWTIAARNFGGETLLGSSAITSGDTFTLQAGGNVTLTHSDDKIVIESSYINNYLNALSMTNTTLTASMVGLSDRTIDLSAGLDTRYELLGHTHTKSEITDFGTYDNYVSWTIQALDGLGSTKGSSTVTSGDTFNLKEGSNVTIVHSDDTLTVSSLNNYLETLSISGATVTAERFGLTNLTLDLSTGLDSVYLGKSAKAADSEKLDGFDSTAFINNTHSVHAAPANLPIGWYTIAANSGSRAIARFGVRDVNSGDHQSVVFYASHHYGANSDITVWHNSKYSGSPIQKIRIKKGGTYDGAMLQIYVDDATNNMSVYLLGDNFQSSGWVLKDWVGDALDPGTVANFTALVSVGAEIDLGNILGGISTTGNVVSDGQILVKTNDSRLSDARTPVTHNHTKSEITDFGTYDNYVSWTIQANKFGGASAYGSSPISSGNTFTIEEGGNVTLAHSANKITISAVDTNNYLESLSISAGILTAGRLNLTDLTVDLAADLDNRYLQSYTETDPIFTASDVFGVTTADIGNWNAAFGWGNHAGLYDKYTSWTINTTEFGGAAIGTSAIGSGNTVTLEEGANISFIHTANKITISANAGDNNYLTGLSISGGTLTATMLGLLDRTVDLTADLDNRYLQSYTETDPIFTASDAYNVTAQGIAYWDEAYGWGDHAGLYLATGLKGVANGLAELGADGLVPSSQLPSYVDDVLEYTNLASFPATGATGKIYVAIDTNITYRWSGTVYVEISSSLALGTTSSTAYRGDHGLVAYQHTSLTGNTHSMTFAQLNSKPTTLSGYSISDAYTKTQIDRFFAGLDAIGGYSKSNWDTAYGWGDHSLAGYLTSYVDTNTTYSISVLDSGANALIRLTAGGSGSGNDDITLVAGTNVTITPSGDNITIASTDTNTTVMTSFTGNANKLFYTNGLGAVIELAHGSAGQVLHSNGATGAPYWAADDNVRDYITGGTFTNGTLALTGVGSASASINLDGRYLQTETDPIFTASDVFGVTTADIGNWDTAHTHSQIVTGNPHNVIFSTVGNKPTTISGYGITDAYTETEINNFFKGTTAIVGYANTNWNTAFGWGDHSLAGYLVATGASYNNTNWDNAFSWGNHAGLYDKYTSWTIQANSFGGTSLGTSAITSGDTFTIEAGGNITLQHSDDKIIIASTYVNNYLTGISGSGNGTLTLTMQGLSNRTVDLSHTHTPTEIGALREYQSDTLVNINTVSAESYVLAKDDGGWTQGTKPAGSHNGFGVISLHTHTGNYATQFGFDSNQNKIWVRSANNATSFGTWLELIKSDDARLSDSRTPLAHNQDISTITGFVDNSTSWDAAASWGDHAGLYDKYTNWSISTTEFGGAAIGTSIIGSGNAVTLEEGANISFVHTGNKITISASAGSNNYLTGLSISGGILTASMSGLLDRTVDLKTDLDTRYLQSYTETDPIFTAHAASGVTGTRITNWDAAFGWGSHIGLYDKYTSWTIQANSFGGTSLGTSTITSGDTFVIEAGGNITLAKTDDKVTITAVDTNNYASGLTGSGNGNITLSRVGLSDLTLSLAHTHTFASLTSKPSTLAGYGITDGMTATAINAAIVAEVGAVIDTAPALLDTLNELAAALGDDPNFATTMTTALAGKSATGHGHAIGDVTGLQDALDLKYAEGTYASTFLGLTPAGIGTGESSVPINFQYRAGGTTLMKSLNVGSDGLIKFDGVSLSLVGHSHAYLPSSHDMTITLTGDVTGTGTFTNMGNLSFTTTVVNNSHAHTIANVTGLQDALDSKMAVHTHPYMSTSHDANVITTQAIDYWDEAWGWGNHAGLYSLLGHSHAIGDVTNLQTTLDAKYVAGTFASDYIGVNAAGITLNSPSIPLRLRYRNASNTLLHKDLRIGTNGILEIDGVDISLVGHTHAYLASSHDMKITLTGDVTGTGTFTNMGDLSFATVVANDSHTHSTYALTSHGLHVPAAQTANNAIYLRNDNTWQTISPADIGALASGAKAADSQLLDGIDSSRFVYGTNANKTTNVSDVNVALASGFYDGSSATGSPTATWYTYMNMRHNNVSNNYGGQLAMSFYSNADVYVRNINNGSYGTWAKLYSTANKPTYSDVGAAAASHGLHVPTAQTANNAIYLRNDNTWQTITPGDISAAPAIHSHSYMPIQNAQTFTTIATSTWDKPLADGYFAKNDSVGKPNGATHGYWHVLGRRDSSAGYAGIWINDYLTTGKGAWIGRNATGGDPTWEKIYTNETFLAGTHYMPMSGGVLAGTIGRSAHNNGFLVGSYNNVGVNSAQTNPIYTIGTSYMPNAATLGTMYGVGYSHTNASFLTGVLDDETGWGLYVASAGVARIFLNGEDGAIAATGNLRLGGSAYLANGTFTGSISGVNGTFTGTLSESGALLSNRYLGKTAIASSANQLENGKGRPAAAGSQYLSIDSSNGWAYLSFKKSATTIWDIGQYNGGNFEVRSAGSTTRLTVTPTGNVIAQGQLYEAGNRVYSAANLPAGTSTVRGGAKYDYNATTGVLIIDVT